VATTVHIEGQLEQHRRELTAYCYRMLASPFEAEDAVQETMIRAWRGFDRFEGRAAVRSWLYRIATNVCLDMLNGRDRRPRPMDLGPAGAPLFENLNVPQDVAWLQPLPTPEDEALDRESVRLAFVAALQHLPPKQRAVLILSEVLRWQATEGAELLETTVASVNSALQRARAAFEPSRDRDQVTLPRSRHEAETVELFVDALERGDIELVVALLTDDARMTMPPEPFELQGSRPIAEYLCRVWGEGVKVVLTRANNAPALGYYRQDPHADVYRASGLMVVSVAGARVSSLTRFGDKSLFATFGLPRTITHK
jgi:RNA polymerase sigma-70 factor (ECF subfamily)